MTKPITGTGIYRLHLLNQKFDIHYKNITRGKYYWNIIFSFLWPVTTPITGTGIWKNIRLYESDCYIRLYILIIFYAWPVTTPITGTGI